MRLAGGAKTASFASVRSAGRSDQDCGWDGKGRNGVIGCLHLDNRIVEDEGALVPGFGGFR